jgi:CRP-like cAMP-binding protein
MGYVRFRAWRRSSGSCSSCVGDGAVEQELGGERVSPPKEEQLPRGNRLLDALPDEELERLRPHLESVSLGLKDVLVEPDEPIEHVYFPINGACSMIATMKDGQEVEVGTIGNEGMLGLPVFLERETVPLRTISQVPGEAVRMRSEALRREVRPGDRLHRLLHRYTEATLVFAAQSSACNRLHSVEQRASRWLLHTHDRVGKDEFPLTQVFLALMLGVRRASVSEVASALQKQGSISYNRGLIKILDRPGLEAKSCECYDVIRAEFNRLPG